MTYRYLAGSFIIPLALGLTGSVSFAADNYLVEWDESCVGTAAVRETGEQLTEDISKISGTEVSQVESSRCAKNIEKDQKVRLSTNDSQYTNQWALQNTGKTIGGSKGTSGVDIGFSQGYSKISGTPLGNTVVAVVDTGVSSIGELSGRLIPGRNTITDSSNTNDDNGHGTFITSLIAARVGNSAGIAGVNDRVRIMPVKVLDENGEGFVSDLIQGIDYAIENDAHIINLSLVSNYTSSLDSVIQKAHSKGIIILAATGNEGKNLANSKVSPVNNDGNNDWVIGVGAHTNTGARASFSNFGTGTDVMAPGQSIVGMNTSNNSEYRSGTSAAAAVATGVVAAWRDYYGKLTPSEAHTLIDQYSTSSRLRMDAAMVRRNYPNGMLIKSPNSGVYLVSKGLKRPIPSPEVFLSHDFQWGHIATVATNDFNAIPNGPALTFREGSLVANSSTVFVIENEQKRPVASPQVFLSNGYSWGNVWSVADSQLAGISTGALLGSSDRVLDGSVAYADGTGVFLIENGKKRPVPDPFTYLTQYTWNDVVKVPRSQLNAIPTGSQLLPREGTIVADSGAVYYIEGTTKRPFASPQAYTGLGLSWDRVQTPGDAVLNRLSQGAIIQ